MEVLFSWALPGEVGLATSPHLSGSGEGQAGILGEFQLVVGLTGDGADTGVNMTSSALAPMAYE